MRKVPAHITEIHTCHPPTSQPPGLRRNFTRPHTAVHTFTNTIIPQQITKLPPKNMTQVQIPPKRISSSPAFDR